MAWEPRNFREYSLRWSVLLFIRQQLLIDWDFYELDRTKSQFWVRYPTGDFVRPGLCFQKVNGQRAGAATGAHTGELVRQNIYRLTVLSEVEGEETTDKSGDLLADVLPEELIRLLDGAMVPYYRLDGTGNQRRVASYDFRPQYRRDWRPGEAGERERNLAVMEFSVIV